MSANKWKQLKTGSERKDRRARSAHRRNRRKLNRVLAGLALLILVGGIAAVVWPRNRGATGPQGNVPISMDKSVGAENAPVVVVEYGDFQCPACQFFFQTAVSRLKAESVQSGQVRFVFRHFAFLGDESRWAAEASECANEQGRFWDYYDKLFQEQNGENVGIFARENLKGFASDLGLDTDAFNQCLESGRYIEKVKQETSEGQQAGIRGTPSIFINGQFVENGLDYSTLLAAINAALEE